MLLHLESKLIPGHLSLLAFAVSYREQACPSISHLLVYSQKRDTDLEGL